MKLIIAGGRDFDNYWDLKNNLNLLYPFDDDHIEIVSGGSTGADALGKQFAQEFHIPINEFPANWSRHGKKAGPIRNQHMAEYADALVAFWNGKSRGTRNMITEALKNGLEVHVYRY